MDNIYFSFNGAVHQLPVDFAQLEKIIHACFVRELDEKMVGHNKIKQATKELERVSQLEKVSLDDFVPCGNPFLEDTGHNGYTWKDAEKYKCNLDLDEIEGEVLMSQAFIGSSAYVYVPMLQVKPKQKTPVCTSSVLPKYLIFREDNFVEAKYDLLLAEFIPVKNSSPINSEHLRLLSEPLQESDKQTKSQLMEVPSNFKPCTYNQSLGSAVVSSLKDISKSIVFHNMRMRDFYCQLKYHFSTRGQVLRSISEGDRLYGWIVPNQISSFSSLSYDEVGEVIKKIKDETNLSYTLPYLFNRFLIYRTLEQKEGHFIVGKISGDSHTIHLPYVPVEIRK